MRLEEYGIISGIYDKINNQRIDGLSRGTPVLGSDIVRYNIGVIDLAHSV